MTIKPRTALYLRCSTEKQSLDNQRPDLLRLAHARDLDVVEAYEEKISAVKKRPGYQRMMADAHRGQFDTLVVWSLDRLGRSMQGNIDALLKLDQYGVQVISVKEPWLDTSGPVRDLLIAIFSWMAAQERGRISARTKAGLERAKRKGRKLGRPKRWVNVELARQYQDRGWSLRKIARKLGVSAATICRSLKEQAGVAENRVAESVVPCAA